MESLTLSEAREKLAEIVENLRSSPESEPVEIRLNGKAAAVIISSEAYHRMRREILDKEIDAIFAEFHDINAALASK